MKLLLSVLCKAPVRNLCSHRTLRVSLVNYSFDTFEPQKCHSNLPLMEPDLPVIYGKKGTFEPFLFSSPITQIPVLQGTAYFSTKYCEALAEQ